MRSSGWEPIAFPEHALPIVEERLREQQAEGVTMPRFLTPPGLFGGKHAARVGGGMRLSAVQAATALALAQLREDYEGVGDNPQRPLRPGRRRPGFRPSLCPVRLCGGAGRGLGQGSWKRHGRGAPSGCGLPARCVALQTRRYRGGGKRRLGSLLRIRQTL
jgi:hypothetical protein